MDNPYDGETEHKARLEAERVITRIDRILLDHMNGKATDGEALYRISEAVAAWTDPKEEAR